jgi:pilus assembly protein CpaE
MAAGVRVIVFNADESYGPQLRADLLAFEGVRIVAEVDDAVLLPQAVTQFTADVALVHLDPFPEVALQIAGQVAGDSPDLAVFAVSQSADGQLILSAMRSGIREFLTKPIERDLLGKALQKVTQAKVQAESQGRLISVLGGAGGVGATALATNLAIEIADLNGGGVALVDLDFRFGQVATVLDLDTKFTITDLCETTEQLEPQVVERALVRHSSGVRVLARPNAFAQAENITAAHTVGALTTLLSMHQYVVVDGPIRFDVGAKAVLDIADDILLVMQLLVPCVRNVSRMLDGMRQAGFNLERVKLVCNRAGCDPNNLSVDDVRETVKLPVRASVPDEWGTVCSSLNLGEPLATHAPKSKARLAIRDLAERLYRPESEADEQEAGKKGGLFSKIFADA